MTDVVDEPVAKGNGTGAAPSTSAAPGSAMAPETLVALTPDVATSLGDYLPRGGSASAGARAARSRSSSA